MSAVTPSFVELSAEDADEDCHKNDADDAEHDDDRTDIAAPHCPTSSSWRQTAHSSSGSWSFSFLQIFKISSWKSLYWDLGTGDREKGVVVPGELLRLLVVDADLPLVVGVLWTDGAAGVWEVAVVVSDTVRHQPVPGVKVEQVPVPAQLLVQVAAVVEADSGVEAETVQRVPAVEGDVAVLAGADVHSLAAGGREGGAGGQQVLGLEPGGAVVIYPGPVTLHTVGVPLTHQARRRVASTQRLSIVCRILINLIPTWNSVFIHSPSSLE